MRFITSMQQKTENQMKKVLFKNPWRIHQITTHQLCKYSVKIVSFFMWKNVNLPKWNEWVQAKEIKSTLTLIGIRDRAWECHAQIEWQFVKLCVQREKPGVRDEKRNKAHALRSNSKIHWIFIYASAFRMENALSGF